MDLERAYVAGFNEKERISYEIAQSLLGSSFDLSKSNGFQAYKKKIKAAAQQTAPSGKPAPLGSN